MDERNINEVEEVETEETTKGNSKKKFLTILGIGAGGVAAATVTGLIIRKKRKASQETDEDDEDDYVPAESEDID